MTNSADKPQNTMTDQQLSSADDQFETYMNNGHSAAWDQQWERAIKAYSMAISARPDVPTAYNSLGLALLQVNPPRLQEALKVYQRAHELDHDDPLPLEKSADVLERMGNLQEAARQYLAVADAYLAQRDLEKAIYNWERATRATPGLVRVHQQLALAYERLGNRRQAVHEYLTLASIFQQTNRNNLAIQAVERALRLEPRNPQALNTLQALRSGGELIYADLRLEKDESEVRTEEKVEDLFAFEADVSETETRGPISEAVEVALGELAILMSESDLMENPSAIEGIQAIEYHRVGAVEEATAAYQRAENMGLSHPAMALNLGALFLEQQRWKEAIPYLDRAIRQESLEAGAQFGLGQAHVHLNNIQQAARHLVRCLQIVETSADISEERRKQDSGIYDRLLRNIQDTDDVTVQTINSRFLSLLCGADWKRRVELTRHDIERAIVENPDSVPDIVIVSPEMVSAMKRIDEYMAARKFILAMEECYHVLETEPDYLPTHLRIGQILTRIGQLDRAVEKYRYIADTYLARDDKTRATEILAEVVNFAPMDTDLREHLIELLEEDERWDEILNQYLNLADAYKELGDASNARTTLNQALQMAQRMKLDTSRMVKIYHQLADIEITRLDNRAALRAYENIKNLQPDDEKAREMLIDLNYRLGDPAAAVKEMDALLQVYAKQRKGSAILRLLESWVARRGNDESIRSRLAAVYTSIQQPANALQQYNAVLELQLKAGRHSDACQTIKRVMALKPENPQQYLNLAKQLGCG